MLKCSHFFRTSSEKCEARLSPRITTFPSSRRQYGPATDVNQSVKQTLSNQPDLDLLYLTPVDPPSIHRSCRCSDLYTTYWSNNFPDAVPANIIDVDAFVLFIERSGYLHPRRYTHFFCPGSSDKFVSSKLVILVGGTPSNVSPRWSKYSPITSGVISSRFLVMLRHVLSVVIACCLATSNLDYNRYINIYNPLAELTPKSGRTHSNIWPNSPHHKMVG